MQAIWLSAMSNSSQQMMIREESEHSIVHPLSNSTSICQYVAETSSDSSYTGIFIKYLCEHMHGLKNY